jgi:hypothetical protein
MLNTLEKLATTRLNTPLLTTQRTLTIGFGPERIMLMSAFTNFTLWTSLSRICTIAHRFLGCHGKPLAIRCSVKANRVIRSLRHDISMQVVGQPARDLARHFVQRYVSALCLLCLPNSLLTTQVEPLATHDGETDEDMNCIYRCLIHCPAEAFQAHAVPPTSGTLQRFRA